MKVSHTPGPWHVDTWLGSLASNSGADHDGLHDAVWAGDLLICTTGIHGTEASAENAALIAAAPDLLGALRDLCDDLDQLLDFRMAQVNRERARAIIATIEAAA